MCASVCLSRRGREGFFIFFVNPRREKMNTTEGVMPPFTPSQWKDLEHQALIFKYMMAGIPVPSDLVLPIQRSMEIPKFFNHSSMGYYPYYGKKVDPEPGRCRRTDGKKWRCAKDAHPDSKYCERHMNRGRSRSRKPVETQSISHCNSTVTSLTPTGGGSQCTAQNNFKDLTHHPAISVSQGNSSLQLQIDSASYEMFNKDYRYPHGTKGEVDDHCLFSEASISARSPEMDSSIDTSHNPSWISIPPSKPRNDSIWPCNYSQVQDLHDLRPTTVTSAMSNQQQYCFFGSEFAAQDPMKPDGQSLRLFCDEWPKSRDSWCDLEDERSNQTLCSATELSMSMPMTASDFSGTGSRSDD